MQELTPPEPDAEAQAPDPFERVSARIGLDAGGLARVKRMIVGIYADGFIHAGNLAYLTLLALFPFFIIVTALAQLLGRSDDGAAAVASFLHILPRSIGDLLRPAIDSVLAARTGPLLWLGALVGAWTVGSYIETLREILRRAYGTRSTRAFWHYRIGAFFITIASVMLVMVAFSAQVALTAAEQFVYRLLPFAKELGGWIGLSRVVPGIILFVALYSLIYALTPSIYRFSRSPKWPGALFVAFWWLATTAILPSVLERLGGYNRTYGSLAGVIIMLFFFWLVGFGMVIGAHLNAALAKPPQPGVKGAPNDREEMSWPD